MCKKPCLEDGLHRDVKEATRAVSASVDHNDIG